MRRKGAKRGRREVKTLGAPTLVVREVVERHTIDQMPRRVSRRIRAMGSTHRDIAAALGVSGAVLSENTHSHTMSLEFFRRLCEALGIDEEHECWTEPLPKILSVDDGAQVFIKNAQQRAKKLAGKT